MFYIIGKLTRLLIMHIIITMKEAALIDPLMRYVFRQV